MPDVHDVLGAMGAFAERVRSGIWVGATGKRIRTVVNIGIGGSDLGPAMAYRALRAYSEPELSCRFVSNVDGAAIAAAVADLDPAETLFVISSKTFTTIETLTNARTARAWLVDALGEDAVAQHFVAVSTNADEVAEFGIDTDNMFGFWEWVGGRYSVDSAIGLSLMIAIGAEQFAEFLAGFRVDRRALPDGAARRERAGACSGMIGVWNRNVLGFATKAVLPYAEELVALPGLPPAARHGVERQVGAPRRLTRHARHRADRVGRAGHERPARLLPAAPPGHRDRARRLHRLRQAAPRPIATITTCSSPT